MSIVNREPSNELKNLIERFADSYKSTNQIKEEIISKAKEEGIDNASLKSLLVEAFKRRGLTDRWIRNLLPEELKDTSKTKKSIHLQRNSNEEVTSSSSPKEIPLETKHTVIDVTPIQEESRPTFTTADQLSDYNKSDNGVYVNKDYQEKQNISDDYGNAIGGDQLVPSSTIEPLLQKYRDENTELKKEIERLKEQTQKKTEEIEVTEQDAVNILDSALFAHVFENADDNTKTLLTLLKNNLSAYKKDAENYKKKYNQLVEESNSNTEKPNYFTYHGYWKYKVLGEWEEIPTIFEVDVRKQVVEAVEDKAKHGEELEELQQARRKAKGW